jgi:hypothetical protein
VISQSTIKFRERMGMPARRFKALLLMVVTAGGVALTACVVAASTPTDLSGVWMIEQPVSALKTAEGSTPPLLPDAQRLYETRLAARRAGDTSFDQTTWCAAPGIPRLMFIPYPFQIILGPRRALFLYEWDRWARVVDLVSSDLEVVYPVSLGVATGHRQGSTLVIKTAGLKDGTLLDSAMPHSEELKLTERLRLLNRNRLENRLTFDDPRVFSRPWETVVTYRRQPADSTFKEDVCLDRIKQGESAIK